MWGATKAVLKGKYIVLNDYILKGKKKSQINNLSFYLKKLEKEEQNTQIKQKEKNFRDSESV